ncbi:MAG: ArsA family ATPase, partial [Firmicutes bacterium]|nr:ArsA family ATPase [Bacillota bacterium]
MRVIVYTGKGGVGKTSVAAATGLLAARRGYRTIVVSTDAAHSLGDSYQTKLGPEPVPLEANLWAQEIDALHEMERNWGKIQDYLGRLLSLQNLDRITIEELTVFPGTEELFSLLEIARHVRAGRYDVIVVDCAPTGETLRLLSYPDILRWWMDRVFPVQRRAMKVLRPVAQPLVSMPLPGDDVFEATEALFNEVDLVHRILADTSMSSVRLVLNPESMVISEARRSFTYLNLFGFRTDAVVVNRVVPDEVTDEYFAVWKAAQERHLETIEECFGPLPILKAPLYDREVLGVAMLEKLGRDLFGDRDPTEVFFDRWPQTVTREDGLATLTVLLPFVGKGDIHVTRVGSELVVHVGDRRRAILLPRSLA